MTYTIQLEQFQGPFDLLLFFIERDELDIHDIPIAQITDEFLAYIRKMEELNIDLASEFILVAATLMRIKAKMLIPRPQIDEEGNEIDPREELVARLIEYKKYKSILDEMRDREEYRSKQVGRGNVVTDLKIIAEKAMVDAELESLTLFKLLKTFHKVMERYEYNEKKKSIHKVFNFAYTVTDQKKFIFAHLKSQRESTFKALFGICENRIQAVVTFLAMLELLNAQHIEITMGEGLNNFIITKLERAEQDAPFENDEDEENNENENGEVVNESGTPAEGIVNKKKESEDAMIVPAEGIVNVKEQSEDAANVPDEGTVDKKEASKDASNVPDEGIVNKKEEESKEALNIPDEGIVNVKEQSRKKEIIDQEIIDQEIIDSEEE